MQQRDHLSSVQHATLAAIGDALVPGAAKAGLVAFVEQQLDRENPALFMKFRENALPPVVFYRQALDALDQLAHARHQSTFATLPPASMTEIIEQLIAGEIDGWDGPSPDEVFTALRMDAFDAFYATPQGYHRLGLELRAHIVPEQPW